MSPVQLRLEPASVTEHVADESRLLEPLGPAGRKTLDRALRTLLGSLEGDRPS